MLNSNNSNLKSPNSKNNNNNTNNNQHILEVDQYNIPAYFQATASTIPDNNKSLPTFQTLQTNEDQRESLEGQGIVKSNIKDHISKLNLFYSMPGSKRDSI